MSDRPKKQELVCRVEDVCRHKKKRINRLCADGVCRHTKKDPCVGSTEEQEELVCRVKDWIVCRSVCVTQLNQ